MLIAGDIGATTTRLALVSAEAGPRHFLAERHFRIDVFAGLQPIVEAFLKEHDAKPGSACFDVAGPVIEGRAHLTNLPWDVGGEELRRDLGLDHVTLLNDLEAVAHAIPHLTAADVVEVNAGRVVKRTPIAVLAPGTGLGEAFLIWDGGSYVPARRKAGTPTSRRPTKCRRSSGRT